MWSVSESLCQINGDLRFMSNTLVCKNWDTNMLTTYLNSSLNTKHRT